MKTINLIIGLLAFSFSSFAAPADGTRPGDNLDLSAVLELFKKSKDIEDFERKLNEEGNEVNNLDLNDDGYVDYITVIDYQEGDAHAITLRVPFTESESQDVAVIEIEEVDGETVNLQIVGDEDLYGTDHFVEPTSENETTAANVKQWTPIKHIYSPKYVVWVSPWRFGVYPTWHRPWKRVAWSVYHPRVTRYHAHYRVVHYRRGHRAHIHYKKHRAHSVGYHNHHHGKHHPHKNNAKKKSAAPAPKAAKSNRKKPGAKPHKSPNKH